MWQWICMRIHIYIYKVKYVIFVVENVHAQSGWIILGKFEQRGLKYWPFPSDRYIAVFIEDTRGNEIGFTSLADPAGLIKLITTNHGKFTFYKWSYSNFITTDFYPSAVASIDNQVRSWMASRQMLLSIN